jgi:ABC-2 type transport system permease protein
MYRLLLFHEWLGARNSRAASLTLLLAPALIFTALYQGERRLQKHERLVEAMIQEADENRAELSDKLREQLSNGKIEYGHNDPGSPSSVGRSLLSNYAILPTTPQAILAVGQSDILPTYYRVVATQSQSLYHAEEIGNPLLLTIGEYDFSFFLVYLFPLVILLWHYDLLSRERETGMLPLLISGGLSPDRIFLARFALRNAWLFLLTTSAAALGMLSLGHGIAHWSFLVLLTLIACYQAFWSSAALLVNSYRGVSARNAAVLLCLWLLTAFIAPSAINALANAAFPVPSRLLLINEQREAAMEAANRGSQLLARFAEDHPELALDRDQANFNEMDAIRFAVAAEIEEAGAPFFELFRGQRERQFDLVRRLRFLSPAFLVRENVNDLAARGDTHFAAFESGVEDYRRELFAYFAGKALRGQRMTFNDYNETPVFKSARLIAPFSWKRFAVDCLFMCLLAVALLSWATRRLRQPPLYV